MSEGWTESKPSLAGKTRCWRDGERVNLRSEFRRRLTWATPKSSAAAEAKTRRWRDGGAARWLMHILVCCGLALSGCARTVTWQEEVQLSDGRVIVVEQEMLRVWGGDELAHGGSGSRPKERRIRLVYPAGSKQIVEWRSTKVDGNLWPEDPLVLDLMKGDVVVMTAVHTSSACVTYFKYVFRDGRWIEEPLPDEFSSRATNLFLMSGSSMPAYVDLDAKNNKNQDIRYPRRLKQVGPHRSLCHG